MVLWAAFTQPLALLCVRVRPCARAMKHIHIHVHVVHVLCMVDMAFSTEVHNRAPEGDCGLYVFILDLVKATHRCTRIPSDPISVVYNSIVCTQTM